MFEENGDRVREAGLGRTSCEPIGIATADRGRRRIRRAADRLACAHQRRVDEVLGDEPRLHLVCAHDLADRQIGGAEVELPKLDSKLGVGDPGHKKIVDRRDS